MTEEQPADWHRPGCSGRRVKEYLGARLGDLMQRCRECSASRVAPESEPQAEPEPRGRYWLGCIKCDRDLWLDSSRPRLPLCPPCLAEHNDHRRARASRDAHREEAR